MKPLFNTSFNLFTRPVYTGDTQEKIVKDKMNIYRVTDESFTQ